MHFTYCYKTSCRYEYNNYVQQSTNSQDNSFIKRWALGKLTGSKTGSKTCLV